MGEEKIKTNEKREKKQSEEAYYSSRPKFGGKGPGKLSQYFNRGMTYFLVVAASILFYFALLRLTNVSYTFGKIFSVLKPVIYGAVIAYLLNPLVKKVDVYLVPQLKKYVKKENKAEKISRGIGIFAALVFLISLIVVLCNLLLPELFMTIRNTIFILPGQLNDLMNRVNEIQFHDTTTSNILKTVIEEGSAMLQTWLREDLLSDVNEWMSNFTVDVINFFGEIFDMLIGIMISVYILYSKELFARQSKKMVYAMLKPNHANMVLHLTTKSNEIFGKFVIGKIIDSAIIGVLCFIGVSILNMPYTVLVSVIVGVTNVIPFFGPYIGAIPCTILILLSDPIKGVYFVLFILVLQQLDGNILGPKILGDSTGLSAFWVIVAILVGGGLFGFVGMVMGVPTFAVLYYIAQMLVNNRLEHKNLPKSSDYYDPLSYVDTSGQYVYSDEQMKKTLDRIVDEITTDEDE